MVLIRFTLPTGLKKRNLKSVFDQSYFCLFLIRVTTAFFFVSFSLFRALRKQTNFAVNLVAGKTKKNQLNRRLTGMRVKSRIMIYCLPTQYIQKYSSYFQVILYK